LLRIVVHQVDSLFRLCEYLPLVTARAERPNRKVRPTPEVRESCLAGALLYHPENQAARQPAKRQRPMTYSPPPLQTAQPFFLLRAGKLFRFRNEIRSSARLDGKRRIESDCRGQVENCHETPLLSDAGIDRRTDGFFWLPDDARILRASMRPAALRRPSPRHSPLRPLPSERLSARPNCTYFCADCLVAGNIRLPTPAGECHCQGERGPTRFLLVVGVA
jgi:hypothetical protein